jgi:hypothetical protein
MVLVQQWNWSYSNPGFLNKAGEEQIMPEAQFSTGPGPGSEYCLDYYGSLYYASTKKCDEEKVKFIQSGYDPWSGDFADEVTMILANPAAVLGIELYLEYDQQQIDIIDVEDLYTEGRVLFKGHDPESGALLVSSVDLGNHSAIQTDSLFRIRLEFKTTKNSPLKIHWRIDQWSGETLSAGKTEFTLTGFHKTPQTYALYQNYPNPFNSATTLRYQMPVNGMVHISIYNVLGQKVQTLLDARQKAGYHSLVWETNSADKALPTGLYIVNITAAGDDGSVFTRNTKSLLLK